MSKRASVIIGVIGLLVLGYFSLSFFIKSKIKNALSEPQMAQKLSYENLSVNLLKGEVKLDSIRYTTPSLKGHAAHLAVQGISLPRFLFSSVIAIKELDVASPEIKIIQSEDSPERKADPTNSSFDKTLEIEKIKLKNGKFTLEQENTTKLTLDSFDGNLENFRLNRETLQQKIPFSMGNYEFDGEEFSFLLNKLQTLRIKHFTINTDSADLNNLNIQPNYSRSDYSKVIPYEKDLMDIAIQKLRLKNYSFSLEKSGKLTADKIILHTINANIYRNKLVRDDPTTKKLYSRMLRELPFKIGIDTLAIKKASLTYEEVQEKTKKTGKVFFKDLHAQGRNITNINLKSSDFPETQFHIVSQFMGVAPLTVDWYFKINNPRDQFRIIGKGEGITADAINNFFIPGMNMKAKGEPIKKLYFDFSGDGETASGKFLMVYDDLKIDVLKKDGAEKNDIFSAIANLFVSHKNEANKDAVDIENVKRDKKRSFWNYLWTSVFTGLKKTML